MALRTKPFYSIRGKLLVTFLFFVIIPTRARGLFGGVDRRYSVIKVNSSTIDISRNYQTLRFDHGTNPTGEAYPHVLRS